ncbi:hypothetical protein DIPPA_33284 [Diplonema papillatum]|nr:hypothetical protein DIPPA_33284 [Diplonema papillatum]
MIRMGGPSSTVFTAAVVSCWVVVSGARLDPVVVPTVIRETIPTEVPCPASCSAASALCDELFNDGTSDLSAASCTAGGSGVTSFTCICNGYTGQGPTYTRRNTTAGTCIHDGTSFPPSPPFNPKGSRCTMRTGVCRAKQGSLVCSDNLVFFCQTQGSVAGTERCVNGDIATCQLCLGGVLRVNTSTAMGAGCQTWEPTGGCTEATCSRHGCCAADGKCMCFDGENNGYWAGAACDACDPSWKGPECTDSKISLTLFFGGEPSASPAVIPFLVILIVFTCFAGCRKRWSHEQAPPLDGRSRLVGEAFHQSTYDRLKSLRDPGEHSIMYIPPRTARSRGLKNQLSRRQDEGRSG